MLVSKTDRSDSYEVFFVRCWNGYDHRGAALFCLSRKNEILDQKNCYNAGTIPAKVWNCAYGTGAGFDLLREELDLEGCRVLSMN